MTRHLLFVESDGPIGLVVAHTREPYGADSGGWEERREQRCHTSLGGVPKSEKFLRLLELLGKWSDKGKFLVFVHTQDKHDSLLRKLFHLVKIKLIVNQFEEQYLQLANCY